MLRKSLLRKRYFIVLDDMWDDMARDDLRLSLAMKVGEYVTHHTNPYFHLSLALKESWELLQKKVFRKEACPFELHNVSLEVSRRCKGLSLVVILVADIIKRKMEESWWHEPCFLYMGMFPEDHTISASKLTNLWIAVKGNYNNFKLSNNELSEIASKLGKPFHQHLRLLRMTMIKGEVSNWNSFSQFTKLRLLKLEGSHMVKIKDHNM
ncbi:hypothetical protein H5410_045249, partial [Solanum commersonii]